MGIQINGQTGNISASDGNLTVTGYKVEGPSSINIIGVVTATSFVGDGSALTGVTSAVTATYATSSGVSTNVSGGIASVTSLNVSGISTLGNVKIGTGSTTLIVEGDARVTGILTVGTASVTIDGTNTQINVGAATTIHTGGFRIGSSDLHSTGLSATNLNVSGVVTATSFNGSGTNLTDLNASNLSSGVVPASRITSTSALNVGGDLYVSGNISFGGTTTQLNTSQLTFSDPDLILGIGTTSTFNPTDNTANHGGIAIASTEGSPLVNLNIAAAETLPTTYKKWMWFKNNTAGLGTDAWLSNFAVGIGSTQFPTGTRFASGTIQFSQSDINVVRNINSSGVVTATSFVGDGSGLTGAGSTVANDTTTNATFYPVLTQTTTGTITASKVSTTKLSFNPSTGTLTATAFSGSGASLTGVPVSTGVSGLGANVATFLATPSSANLAAAVTDETGSGSLVFANTPTLTTPNIGAATGTSLSVSGQLTSTVATGTAPLSVTSTTLVTNLNADKVDGYDFVTTQGISAIGNFGQWEPHGTYTNLNASVTYWGWSYVQGNTNAPNSNSSQWYRNRVSLGSQYGLNYGGSDYWLEMAYPRSSQSSAGHMWMRLCEAGVVGSWTQIGANIIGNFTATGNVTAYSSDRRLKENFNHIESPLEKVQKLNGYTFDWNKKSEELGFIPQYKTNDVGLIAQEVQAVLPQAAVLAPFDRDTNEDGETVSKSGENYLTIQYERLVPLLVEAIKEQQEQINTLKERIEILEK